jgi:hypothetical protein
MGIGFYLPGGIGNSWEAHQKENSAAAGRATALQVIDR